MLFRYTVCLILLLMIVAGCGSDSTSSGSGSIVSAELLGLTEDHSLEYFQIDTTITYILDTAVSPDPIRVVTATRTNRTFSLNLEENNWVISDGNQPLLNLIVSGKYVLHNGYYTEPDPARDIIYFESPSILMSNGPKLDEPWESYTEPYVNGDDTLTFNGYLSYFGFYSQKRYIGQEEIIITSGAYQVHRFEIDLFARATDTTPLAHATEYYSSGLGLVKLRFEDTGFIRTLNLLRSIWPLSGKIADGHAR